MEKRIIDENTGIEYVLVDNIYYPIFILDDEGYNFGKYGNMRLSYLKEHKTNLYIELLVKERLYSHIENIENTSLEWLKKLQNQYIQRNPLPDNNNFIEIYKIRQQAFDYAEEIIKNELIYS